jgi:hypothetical protein
MEMALDRATNRRSKRHYRVTKAQPLTRSALDGRTNAAKLYDRLVLNIQNDLGGADACSTVENTLIEAFAGAAVSVSDLNTRLLAGQAVSLVDLATAISSLVRVASRIGLKRIARDITPLTLQDIARDIATKDIENDDDPE